MKLSLFQVDAFTDKVFSGNPAAVCPLEVWLSDDQMQCIAAENNLSETAFCVRQGDAYGLRWFTPKSEVQLCGHATLATAFVLFHHVEPATRVAQFKTCGGLLKVCEEDGHIVMDFPSLPARSCAAVPQDLLQGLSPQPKTVVETGQTAAERNYFVVYEREQDVRSARPNLSLLEKMHPAGVCITAPGEVSDFVSRYFAPSYGVPEDPVTGSTHCTLGPYWAPRLKKSCLHARQLSPRGGELLVEPRGGRVLLKGKAVLYLTGTVTI